MANQSISQEDATEIFAKNFSSNKTQLPVQREWVKKKISNLALIQKFTIL